MKIRVSSKIKYYDIIVLTSVFLLCTQFFTVHGSLVFCEVIDRTGLKHIFVVGIIALGFISEYRGKVLRLHTFIYELARPICAFLIVIFISFVYMGFNGFSTAWMSELYFLVAPLLYVYAVFSKNNSIERFVEVVDWFLYMLSALYLVYIFKVLLSNRSLYFSFVESTSPFEKEVAHMFLLMYIFYSVLGSRRKRIVAAVFCVLAWKRMSLLFLVAITVLNPIIRKEKRVSRKYYLALTAIFVPVPVLMQLILTDQFANWFNETFGVDLIGFLMFRFQLITAAFHSNVPSRGLGTYSNVSLLWYGHIATQSMHNDIVRLYLEVSVLGLACFLYGLSSIAKNIYSFLVIGYMFVEMAASHMLGNGGMPFWILAYTLIFCFNKNLTGPTESESQFYITDKRG